jgi:hypothetical protein
MYGPPPNCKRKEEVGLVGANVYGLRRSEKTPGQDGMRCARDPFSNAVLGDFFLQRVPERRVRPLCHLLVRLQTWREAITFRVQIKRRLTGESDRLLRSSAPPKPFSPTYWPEPHTPRCDGYAP